MATRKSIPAEAPRARRVIEKEEAQSSSSYFTSGNDKDNLEFVSSGCSVMDEALGGGFVLGRCANIVGDKSSGKTLIAMETIANFCIKYPDGWVRYAEAEAAFDEEYAEALGVPVKRITFNAQSKHKRKNDAGSTDGPMETVEELYDDLVGTMAEHKGRPGIYIIDSLDSLSDDAEQKREFDEGTYGGTKPKQIGKLFRMLVGQMEEQRVLFIVISQLRDKLNVTFGETKTRSGGRALDFYATHIMWLAQLEMIKKTIEGIERVIGIKVESYVKKNKVGLAFRKAKYPILFGYGIDDMTSSVEWLIESKREHLLAPLGLSKSGYKVKLLTVRDKGGAPARELRAELNAIVRREWAAVETGFLPKSSKY